jgi:hypothetical protein
MNFPVDLVGVIVHVEIKKTLGCDLTRIFVKLTLSTVQIATKRAEPNPEFFGIFVRV